MKRIIAIVNHKGGVGKTTTAVNLAAAIGERTGKVLLVDLDPQGSASRMLGVESDGQELLDALQRTAPLPVVNLEKAGIDLVASGPRLAEARQRFTGSIGTELLVRCLRQTNGPWQHVLLDCPPSLCILTRSALLASHEVLTPAETTFLAFAGLQQMLAAVTEARSTNKDLSINAIVPCRVQLRRKIHREFMEKFEELFPGKVTPEVRENVTVAEAAGHGLPVTSYAPKSTGAYDYRQVADWLIRQEQCLPRT